MTRILSLFLAVLLSAGTLPASAPIGRGELQARTISRVFSKLRAGRSLTVACLGGSGTSGFGLERPADDSFPALVVRWLRRQFPHQRIDLINAGVPATGSLYGTLRLRRDLLSLKPDLVLVELGSEDAAIAQPTVAKAVEGILRQLLVQAEPPEVLLLVTAAPPTPPADSMGLTFRSVADHYSIPVIDLWTNSKESKEPRSPIQPANPKIGSGLTGAEHRLDAEQIIALLRQQMSLSDTPILRRLPQPLISDELNYGEFKVLAEFVDGKNWRNESNNMPHFPTQLAVSDAPGATIEAVFEGTVVGLTWLQEPNAGSFEVLIDGQPAPSPLTRVDAQASQRSIGTGVIPGGLGLGEHRLTIRLIPEPLPGRRGRRVRLGFLLIGGQRPERL